MSSLSSPLFDTLFRPTTGGPRPGGDTAAGRPDPRPAGPVAGRVARSSASRASAAPVRATGTRTRAGNAMSRTRRALLTGAAEAVAVSGTRIAMAQVAIVSGVAKATLYNHFRTRDAVLDALLTHEVTTLVEAVDGLPLDEALVETALALGRHPVRQGLADVEPATLARLAVIDPDAPAWQLAREGVETQLERAGRGGVDLVLRWLASFLLTPAEPDAVRADVELLVAALPAATVGDTRAERPAV